MLGDRREEEKSVRGPKRSITQSRRDSPRVCLFRKQGKRLKKCGWSTGS